MTSFDGILKIQLHPELNLPPGSGAAGQFAERWVIRVACSTRRSYASERRAVRTRKEKRRRVGDVKKFRAKLQHDAFGNARVLENGEVRVPGARSARHPASRIAKILNWSTGDARRRAGNGKRRWIEEAVHARIADI